MRKLSPCQVIAALLPTIVFATFALSLSTVDAAEFRVTSHVRDGVTEANVVINGRIERRDGLRLEALVEDLLSSGRGLRLDAFVDSPGGDVEAAIAVGRLLRRIQANVWVSPGAQCLSSCVFLLAGGDMKLVMDGARVGIHRPYITDMSYEPSYSDVQSLYLRVQATARKYLQDMHLNASLVDEMFSVPPEKMRILTKQDLERFGLNQSDPVGQEMRDLAQSKRLGISRAEYLGRKARLDAVCTRYQGNTDAMKSCVSDVMEGRK